MEAAATNPGPKTTFDPYALITEKVCAKLEQGIVPWQKLWDESGQPRNLITKAPYTGINAVLLGMEEYEHNWFLSFDEVSGIGGKVKKGTKGHTVVRWVKNEPKEGQEKDSFMMKLYTVFNVAQCDKIPERFLTPLQEKPVHQSCEFIATSMQNPPKVESTGPNAFYEAVEDAINMPKGKSKKKDAAYYAQLFKQLIHSTGHDSRLARKGVAEMSELADKPLYTKEDLVGDIGMCFLLGAAGIHTAFGNGKGYVPGWLAKLKEDKKLIVIAANQAQKAVDYILNQSKASDKQP